jgi:hypothetical protein
MRVGLMPYESKGGKNCANLRSGKSDGGSMEPWRSQSQTAATHAEEDWSTELFADLGLCTFMTLGPRG